MAADYQVSGNQLYKSKFEKAIYNKRFLFGVCGNLRSAQVAQKAVDLRYSTDIPAEEVVSDVIIPNMMAQMEAEKTLWQKEGVAYADIGFVVCIDGRIFTIDGDMCYIEIDADYYADGSGGRFALGALSAMEAFEMSPRSRILMALKPAVDYGVGVFPPIKIINSEGHEEKLSQKDFFIEMEALSGFEMDDEGPIFEDDTEMPEEIVSAMLGKDEEK